MWPTSQVEEDRTAGNWASRLAYWGPKAAGTFCRFGCWGPGLGQESGSVVEKVLVWHSSRVLSLVCRSRLIGKLARLEEDK